jgi:hypothetical protein
MYTATGYTRTGTMLQSVHNHWKSAKRWAKDISIAHRIGTTVYRPNGTILCCYNDGFEQK